MFKFPELPAGSYEKILMKYSMRCKGGRVSDGADRNKGCGEWDYSSNTFITDSSLTDSVKSSFPSHAIGGFTGTTFNYRTAKTYDLIQHEYIKITGGTTTSEVRYPLSGYSYLEPAPLVPMRSNRVQVLFTKDELSAASIPTLITKFSLHVNSASGIARNFRIRLKNSDALNLSPQTADTTGFTQCFFNEVTLGANLMDLEFYQDFNRDITKGLIIEISYDLVDNSFLNFAAESPDTGKAIRARSGGNIDFSGTGFFNVNAGTFANPLSRLTFAFWTKGDPNFIPKENTTFLEGVDASNNRQANAHLPWSDQNVYWDCGNDGTGYDRVNAQANPSDYAGNWHHWVLTKDGVSGRMSVYKDGSLFTQGGGKYKMTTMNKLNIGGSADNSLGWFGQMSSITLYDTAVNTATAKGIFQNNPATVASLLPNEKFNLKVGNTGLVNLSVNQVGFNQVGSVAVSKEFAYKLFHDFEPVVRPGIDLLTANRSGYTTTKTIAYDTVYHSPRRIVKYAVGDHKIVAVDTTYGYNSTEGKIYDEAGNVVSAIPFTLDKTITITTLNYYATVPQRLELMSFVTPYGIGLDLGPEGKTWQFDVSDFEPVLKGNKYISMAFGGEYQEEIDIKFLFIKGTPARIPKSIQQIWKVEQKGYQEINGQTAYEQRSVMIPTGTSSAKIRSVISGHGQEGEFIPQNHLLTINNGQKEFTHTVWKSCSSNPVYPQGGTWPEDRAGWCPGMATDLVENEITNLITAGQPMTIKYSVSNPGGDSRYIANHQLVTYGPASFSRDAALVRIIKPSPDVEMMRINPACSSPFVVVKNNGSNPLTSIGFEFWVNEDHKETYTWSGNLNFLDQDTISLPISGMGFWYNETKANLTVKIVSANGSVDSYEYNDKLSSAFTMPRVFGNKIGLYYRTNLYPEENAYRILDKDGNVVVSKGNFAASTNYSDTLNLAEGCYTMEFLDTRGDGLYYWYWEAAGMPHGTGSLRIKDLVKTFNKVFEPEFGDRVVYEFSVSNTLGLDEVIGENNVNIYPNPSNPGIIQVYTAGDASLTSVEVRDELGRIVAIDTPKAINTQTLLLDLSGKKPGVYFVSIDQNGKRFLKKLVLY